MAKASELTSSAAAAAKETAAKIDDKYDVSAAAKATSDAAATAANTTVSAAKGADDKYLGGKGSAAVGAAATATTAAAATGYSAAIEAAENTAAAASTEVEKARGSARLHFLKMAETFVDKATVFMSRKMKDKIYDPDMPRALDRGLQGVVDEFMPEVKTILMDAVTDKVRKKNKASEEALMTAPPRDCCTTGGNCLLDPLLCFRAKVLYTLVPFDKSTWGKMKEPLFWLIMCINVCPVFGVAQLWGIVLLAMKVGQWVGR